MSRLKSLPRPSPDRNLMESIRETGFRVFPERKINYDKYQSAEPMEFLDYQPIMLDIENVSRCNFRCTMCQVSQWKKRGRAQDMTLDEFKLLLENQTGIIEVKLQGMGEPFLGESYFEMIKYARSRHLWIRSTTNGSLLHVNENYKRIIDADICEIQVSVDGATDTTYRSIRKGGNLKRVMKNCRLLNRYAGDNRSRRTRMWVVVQSTNFDELEKMPPLAAELGFNRLTFSLDLNDWGQRKWKAYNDTIDMHRNFTLNRAHDLISIGHKQGVEVTFWFIDEKYRKHDKNRICPWPFQRSYISSDMRVVPCCMIATPDVYDLGNAHDFGSVWNGKKMIVFREMHLSGKIPGVCRSCYIKI
jgi:pyrroloquinoline quinone biosynthesis protein E|tara:strand:- start:871 stop:1947 length:1077 start_codon:yes stop_codon:yes gene_type:complete